MAAKPAVQRLHEGVSASPDTTPQTTRRSSPSSSFLSVPVINEEITDLALVPVLGHAGHSTARGKGVRHVWFANTHGKMTARYSR